MLETHGAPLRIVQSGPVVRIEWPPIAPGLPDSLSPVYELRNPWNDGRRIVSVGLEP